VTRRRRAAFVALVAAGWARAAAAEPCDLGDLDELQDALGPPGAAARLDGPEWLDEALLREAAAAAGCEWSPGFGGAEAELERLRWLAVEAAADDADDAGLPGLDPWWRVFLPRLELRWWHRRADGRPLAGRHEAEDGAFEVWLLWGLAPAGR
jgi:hypothetical protein